MKKAFQDMLHRLGEVNPTHENYNDSCTSKDTEDPSWSTSFKNKRTQKTSSTLEDFISVVIVLVRNIIVLVSELLMITTFRAESMPVHANMPAHAKPRETLTNKGGRPGVSSEAMLLALVTGKGRLKRNGMQLTKQTAEHLPRRGESLAQKAKTTEEDTRSLYQIRKNLARMKKTYPSLGCVKK
ncbi:hypothetical protein Tco_1292164 [Tanacetum coccineum]